MRAEFSQSWQETDVSKSLKPQRAKKEEEKAEEEEDANATPGNSWKSQLDEHSSFVPAVAAVSAVAPDATSNFTSAGEPFGQ
ncbi:hypothetical protein RUM43_003485 [Polyplax serrata]|uniref:Uncharacterized protein n=1 Tax=Polyplax serrata TaxID=468196 RepID=A0AAN8PPE8_POLSC